MTKRRKVENDVLYWRPFHHAKWWPAFFLDDVFPSPNGRHTSQHTSYHTTTEGKVRTSMCRKVVRHRCLHTFVFSCSYSQYFHKHISTEEADKLINLALEIVAVIEGGLAL